MIWAETALNDEVSIFNSGMSKKLRFNQNSYWENMKSRLSSFLSYRGFSLTFFVVQLVQFEFDKRD